MLALVAGMNESAALPAVAFQTAFVILPLHVQTDLSSLPGWLLSGS